MAYGFQEEKYGPLRTSFWLFGAELIGPAMLRALDMAGLVKWIGGERPTPMLGPHTGVLHTFDSEDAMAERWNYHLELFALRREREIQERRALFQKEEG